MLAQAGLGLPRVGADRSHVWYVYVVRSEQRDRLQQVLAEHDVGTGIHFPVPIHLQPATKGLGYRDGDLPHTEQAAAEVLSIPMYPELTNAQIDWVAAAIHEATSALTADRSRHAATKPSSSR